jgi:hypothetical protein
VKTNPLAAILHGGSNGDSWKDVLLVTAIHQSEPEARGRGCGWYRDGNRRELVFAGAAPDLSLVPADVKVIILDSNTEGE